MAGSRIGAVDVHVGKRVKMARLASGLSQEKLAQALGVSFQQLQKYENGANRIGPGRLHAIAKMLNLQVSFFFEGLEKVRPGERDALGAAESALSTKEGVRIALALSRIHSPELRRRVANLLEQMIDDGKQEAESVRRV
jgi:transcriptional regulator with XRE-family HTH domain